MSVKAHSLYLHLPFCKAKCHYCDFVVRVLHAPAQIDRYLAHLALELAALAPALGPLQTLYIGGGTPSVLDSSQVAALGQLLTRYLQLDALQEWTLEVNPESADPAALAQWQALGVNRISLGVQTFEPAELQLTGRSHQLTDIEQAVATLRSLGLANFSLDLIYGLPQQVLSSWQGSLEAALALRPQHLSLYALEVHARTQFGHRSLALPSEEESVQMYELACELLAGAGFGHYEIANWALPACQSQHNRVYWRNLPFAAAGVGAHGYLQGRRYANPSQLKAYYLACQQGQWAWQLTPAQSQAEVIEETVFLGLRLLEEGLDLKAFAARFGKPLQAFYPKVLPRLLRLGRLEERADRLLLRPEAVMICNEIFAEFLEPVGVIA